MLPQNELQQSPRDKQQRYQCSNNELTRKLQEAVFQLKKLHKFAQKQQENIENSPIDFTSESKQLLIWNSPGNTLMTCSTMTHTHVISSNIDENIQCQSPSKSSTIVKCQCGQINLTDTMSYVNKVKFTLTRDNKLEIYEKFLDALNELKNETSSGYAKYDIVTRVKKLLEGYPELIFGFYAFSLSEYQMNDAQSVPSTASMSSTSNNQEDLQSRYEATRYAEETDVQSCEANFNMEAELPYLPNDTARQPNIFARLKVEEALEYLDTIKLTFAQKPEIYETFLSIVSDFKKHKLVVPQVISKVTQLFEGYPQLILGFSTFLPAGFKMPNDVIADED